MTSGSRLRYVDASHVEATDLDLAGFDVITEAGKRLGEFDGLIVDPPARRIHFLVVQRGSLFGQRRVLVPMSVARLDRDHRAVEVDVTSSADCPAFDAEEFAPLSDEDMLAALFGRSDRM